MLDGHNGMYLFEQSYNGVNFRVNAVTCNQSQGGSPASTNQHQAGAHVTVALATHSFAVAHSLTV